MEAVIAGYVRTPFQFARKGAFKDVRPDDLAALTLNALVERNRLDPASIEDVLMGCAYPEAAQGNNIARISSLLAGIPKNVGGATINRFCGSSMYAIHIAAGQIAIGAGEAFIAAGIESMTMVPQGGFNLSPNPRFRREDNLDAEFLTEAYIPMGRTAENVAEKYKVSRQAQDEFAYRSQMKAAEAQRLGLLSDELTAVTLSDGTVIDTDGCLRPNTSLEGLAALAPAFAENGTVTAGTSSPLTDGAVATLITSTAYAERNGLQVLARIRSTSVAGVEPKYMGIGPVPAVRKALARARLGVEDIDVIELNEAFASQAIACIRELGFDPERVNVDGGGIAIGHPLGATGARITAKAAQILRRQGGRYAVASQCIGGGQGIATVLEAV